MHSQADVSEALVNMGIKQLFTRGAGHHPELNNLFEDDPIITADRLLHSAKVRACHFVMILKSSRYCFNSCHLRSVRGKCVAHITSGI